MASLLGELFSVLAKHSDDIVKTGAKSSDEITEALAKTKPSGLKKIWKGTKKLTVGVIGGAATLTWNALKGVARRAFDGNADPNSIQAELDRQSEESERREKAKEKRDKEEKNKREESRIRTDLQMAKSNIRKINDDIKSSEDKLRSKQKEVRELIERRSLETKKIQDLTEENNKIKAKGKLDEDDKTKLSNNSEEIRNASLVKDSLVDEIDLLQIEIEDIKEYLSKLRAELGIREGKYDDLSSDLKDTDKDSKLLDKVSRVIERKGNSQLSTLDKILTGVLLMPAAIQGVKYLVDEGFSQISGLISEVYGNITDAIWGVDKNAKNSPKTQLQENLEVAQQHKKEATYEGAGAIAGNALEYGWYKWDKAKNAVKTAENLKPGGSILKSGAESTTKSTAKAGEKIAEEVIEGTGRAILRNRNTGRFVSREVLETSAGVASDMTARAAGQSSRFVGRGAKFAKRGLSAAKAGAESIWKKIPILGLVIGIGFGIERALKGDWAGAGLEVLSGATSLLDLVPGGAPIGISLGTAIDAGLAVRDYMNASREEQEILRKMGTDYLNSKGVHNINNLNNKLYLDGLLGVRPNAEGVKSVNTENPRLSEIYAGNESFTLDNSRKTTKQYYLKYLGLEKIIQSIKGILGSISSVDNWDQDIAINKLKSLPLSGALASQGCFIINLTGENYKALMREYFTNSSSLLNEIDHNLGASMDALYRLLKNEIGNKEFEGVLNAINTSLSTYSDEVLQRIKEKLVNNLHFPFLVDMKSLGVELTGMDFSDNSELLNYQNVTQRGVGFPAKPGELSNQRNGQRIMQYLVDNYGLKDYQAAGLLGNLYAESRFRPGAYNEAEKSGKGVPGQNPEVVARLAAEGTYGQGIAQWTGERNKNLLDWYNKNYDASYTRISQIPLEGQLAMLGHELETTKSFFLEEIRKARNVREATDIALRGFENGSSNALASREFINRYNWAGGYSGSMSTRESYAQKSLGLLGKSFSEDEYALAYAPSDLTNKYLFPEVRAIGGTSMPMQVDPSTVVANQDRKERLRTLVSEQGNLESQSDQLSAISKRLDNIEQFTARTYVMQSEDQLQPVVPNPTPVVRTPRMAAPAPLINNENLQ